MRRQGDGERYPSSGARDFQRVAEPRHSARNVRRRSPVPFIIGGVAILAIILVVVFVFIYPLRYDVVVNGSTLAVNRGTTIGKIIEDGAVTPAPGDMLAVDGSVYKGGGGNAFSATVNGNPTTDGEYKVDRGDVIDISDGADTTEPYSETEEVIPHGDDSSEADFASYFNGALHVYERGQDGLTVTRTGELSGKVVTEEVTPVINAGFRICTADVGSDLVCALTFDDGPWPTTTDEILDILEENGARATFFTIGNQIAENPEAVRRAYEMGCEVCTHSWDHAAGDGGGVNLTYMSADDQIEEVQKGMDAISEVIGTEAPRIMRAPGGNFYGDIVKTLEPYLDAEIGWEVDTEDWSKPGADAIYQAIMSVKPGQVILMHDGGGDRSQTVEALARAVPELRAQGYSFITISELLGYNRQEV